MTWRAGPPSSTPPRCGTTSRIRPSIPICGNLLHVGFKVAAKMGDRYLHMLDECEETIARNVTTNLYDRHIRPLFLED